MSYRHFSRSATWLTVFASLACYGVLVPSACLGTDTGQSELDPDSLEEVIVTAQKRSQPIGDVEMSITALTARELQDRGVADVSDLEKVVPGFSVVGYSRGAMSGCLAIMGRLG